MNKSSLPWTIKQLKTMYEDTKTLNFEHPVQRKGGQWNNLSMSLLIHSMLANYPVPAIYSIKEITGEVNEKGANIAIYYVLDGKQRLTNIFNFINGEYKLNQDTPNVEIDGVEYELANKTFEDLDVDIQQEIVRFKFNTYNFEDATDDEIEEIFFRLNNGVVLSTNQKAKAKIGVEIAKFIDELLEKKFFAEICSFTTAQLRKADNMCALMQAMMLLDGSYEYKSISADETLKYAISCKNNYSNEQMEELENIINYLGDVYIDKNKWCKKINIPIIILMARKALSQNIDCDDFLDWINEFFDAYTPESEYAQFCSTGSIRKEKTLGRISVMEKSFLAYFKDYKLVLN